jgi:hypothetical protein
LKKSVLAGKLDTVVKDMTDEDRARSAWTKSQLKQTKRELRAKEKALIKARKISLQTRAQSSYPSPDRSPYGSPTPTLNPTEIEDSEDDMQLQPVVCHKRRGSASPESSPDDCETLPVDRLIKRCRKSESRTSPTIGLPSPRSPQQTPDPFDYWSLSQPEQSSSQPVVTIPFPSSNRKRRLSDADGQGAPKRPRGFSTGPRVHAVSDPLPARSITDADLESWFKLDFEFPAEVTADGLDPSAPVEIELFKAWPSVSEINTPPWTTEQVPTQQISTHQIAPVTFDMSWLSESTLNPEIHFLPVETQGPPSLGPVNPPSLPSNELNQLTDPDFNALLESIGFLHDPILPRPTIPDTTVIASTAPFIPDGVDWISYIPQLDHVISRETSEKARQPLDIFQGTSPPTFDFPNPSPADILSRSHEALAVASEKQGKFEELKALEEKMQKLREELAAA